MQEQGVGDDPRRLRIDKPIGSGPFKFGRYRRDTELQLIADKTHFAASGIDEIWAVATPTVDGLMGRLQSQEIDFIEARATLRPSQAKQLAAFSHLSTVRTADLNWLHGVPRVSVLAVARLRVPPRLAPQHRSQLPGRRGVGGRRPPADRQYFFVTG